MSSTADELFDEIANNIREDRNELKSIRDKVIKFSQDDPAALIGIMENVAKVSEVLTKMNSKLVELAKVKKGVTKEEESSEQQVEDMFDQIELEQEHELS